MRRIRDPSPAKPLPPFLFAPFLLLFALHRRSRRVLHLKPIKPSLKSELGQNRSCVREQEARHYRRLWRHGIEFPVSRDSRLPKVQEPTEDQGCLGRGLGNGMGDGCITALCA
jgi:hypothetical protein